MVARERLLLLDTWYTMMSHPPQCKAFLESEDWSHDAISELSLDPGYQTPEAQFLIAAIAAQVCRVQLHLKATGCTVSSPDILKLLGTASYFEKRLWTLNQLFHKDNKVGNSYNLIVQGCQPCVHSPIAIIVYALAALVYSCAIFPFNIIDANKHVIC